MSDLSVKRYLQIQQLKQQNIILKNKIKRLILYSIIGNIVCFFIGLIF